jgi:hypothetical protein
MPLDRPQRKEKSQRFYARKAGKTTLDASTAPRRSTARGRLMRSFRTTSGTPLEPTGIHAALAGFADECCGTLARLIAYVGALALLAMAGLHLWDQSQAGSVAEPSAQTGWAAATRSYPAFAVSQFDSSGKTEAYEILRHPLGGRKDVFRWAALGERPVAELEIYRPGAESSPSEPAAADLAARIEPASGRELEAAGVIDSKFGTIALLQPAGSAIGAPPCLGFTKRLEDADLRISGWSCQGDSVPVRRAAIGCMLDRLVLLTSGNEPKLAETFARAELRRGDCAPGGGTAASADWVTNAENPRLRGRL